MNAPHWVNDIIHEFGQTIGLESFALNDRDSVALRFEHGAMLIFEYAYASLIVMLTMNVISDLEMTKHLLSLVTPERRGDFRMKSGIFTKKQRAFVAIRLPHEEISLPIVNAAVAYLRRFADQVGGGIR